MTDFHFYLSSRDSLDVRKKNNLSDFWIQFPKTYTLEGQWLCALKDISLTCNFTPKIQSKKISNDQELIKSDPTSCPKNQKGNN